MSLKEMIEHWKTGVEMASRNQYTAAIEAFLSMQEPGARIYFNAASMYLRLGNLPDAQENLNKCVKQDPHLALGFFQRGCLHLQNHKYQTALDDFDDAMRNLRGNLLIDYKQLGLMYKFHACEVMYNKGYAYNQLGMREKAIKELEGALEKAAESSESRHKIILAALDKMKRREDFLPYRLPKNSMLFTPPRSKTDVLGEMDFLSKAKVLSSIEDHDSYTGFVGAQRQDRSPSPNPRSSSSRSPSPSPSSPPSVASIAAARMHKPGMAPPPKPDSRSSSHQDSKHLSLTKKISDARPPKPTVLPPAPRPNRTHDNDSQRRSPSSPPRAHSPKNSGAITVKVHYTTTRAMRVASGLPLTTLLHLACKKFDLPDNALTLWYKEEASGVLKQISDDRLLNDAYKEIDDSNLTLWAYDKKKELAQNGSNGGVVVARCDYSAQFDDELTFTTGDRIEVLKEVNEDWYHGSFNGNKGIFPKSYVQVV